MNWASFGIGFGVSFIAFCGASAGVSLYVMRNPSIIMRRMMKSGNRNANR